MRFRKRSLLTDHAMRDRQFGPSLQRVSDPERITEESAPPPKAEKPATRGSAIEQPDQSLRRRHLLVTSVLSCLWNSQETCDTMNSTDFKPSLLLGRDTHRLSETTSGLGVLTTDLQVPVVAQTTVGTIRHTPLTSPTASSSGGSDPHGDWPAGC